jgi:hypothetical protein
MRARVASLVVLLPALVWATTIAPHSLLERARRSDRVAYVQVLDRWSELSPDGHLLKTYTRLVVGEDVKGRGPSQLTLVQLGGRSGALEMKVPGDATFEPGETAVVFLACREPARCTLVALGEGKLSVEGGAVRYRDLVRRAWVERPLGELLAELRGATQQADPVVTRVER